MTQRTKTILGVAGFAALLVGAVLAYNALSKQVESSMDPPETQTQALQTVTGFTTAPGGANWSGTDFTVVDAEGASHKLSDFRGTPVVLNFWASWCPPCRQEMPEFDRAHRELGDEIQFVMVDLVDGRSETVESGARFIRDNGYGFPVYFDTTGQAADAYRVSGIPATFFIDGEGRVVSSQVGALSWAALMRGIEALTAFEAAEGIR